MTSGQNETAEALRDPIPKPTDCAIGQESHPDQTIRQRLTLGGKPIHNFTGDKMNVYRMSALASSPAVVRGTDERDRVIAPQYFYVHMLEMVNEKTGEMTEAARTVIFDRDGKAYGFMSWGVLDSLDAIVNAFGPTDWPADLRVKVVESKTRKGMNIISLVPIS